MSLRRIYSVLVNILWGILLFLLPITSLPLLSRLAGGTMVAPPSAVLALLLIIFWFLPYILKKGDLPREMLPFILFVIIALIASAGAFFIDTPTFKTASFIKDRFEGVLTLFVAVAFYLLAASWHKTTHQIKATIRVINIGGLFLLGWSCLQAFFVYIENGHIPSIMFRIQRLISVRDLLLGRISGFSFEPSWLAHQLNMLYLPIWLGMTLTNISVYKFRIWKFSLENILLCVAMVIVAIASRVGILCLLLVFGYLVIRLTLFLGRRLHTRLYRKFMLPPRSIQSRLSQVLLWIMIIGVVGGLYGIGSIGAVYILGKVDWRLAHVLDGLSPTKFSSLYAYFNHLAFAERYVYWVSGWRLFSNYPLLGVGLGNSGFFFQKTMPSYGWALPEIMDVYIRGNFIPNIKSFWIRILAETGVVGFSAFISWFYTLWRSSRISEQSVDPVIRMIAWAGQFLLIGFLAEGFSVDTFALPYLWLSLGIVTAAFAIYRKTMLKQIPGFRAENIEESNLNKTKRPRVS